ncbi:uncharacterized protein PRCAT00002754001 [Priceomyces carsonii]|uniref:uncharacterized protein n=1 Tax=Priceomyces carsonii TaxID=28549 RepID=UPI002ED87C54|nr:unnamed protein product [Priceomyces carsonii]
MNCCEYLPRVNVLSIIVDFDESLHDLKGVALQSKNHLLISSKKKHTDVVLPIYLPHNNLKIKSVNKTKDCLTISISLENPRIENERTESFVSSNIQKWSCKDLKNKTPKDGDMANLFTFNCISCGQGIIDSRNYKFLDMPSEYWHELMDFWHCHKPHSDEQVEKDYNGKLQANNNDVIMGSYYLQLNEKFTPQSINTHDGVTCTQCHTSLGDLNGSNVRLFKWNLSLAYGTRKETFPKWLYIYSVILDKINISASRKFKIYNGSEGIFLWIIGIGMDVSYSDHITKNSLKILYCPAISTGIEELENVEYIETFPDVLKSFNNKIDKVNSLLPSSSKQVSFEEGGEVRNYKVAYIGTSEAS